MSKKNETKTNATVNTAEILKEAKAEMKEKEPKLSPYATNAMRPVIIQKSLDGNRRAITLKNVEDEGLTEATLEEWKYNVRKLYEAAIEYSKAIETPQEQERENEVWSVWKTIIRVAEEDRFHPNVYIRRKDVENIRVLAAESCEVFVKGIGFVPTVTGETAFRSRIEIRLALRIAGNKCLNDRQREVVKEYQKAEKMIKSANDVLNGYTQGKTTVPSIDAQIAEAEKELDALEKVLGEAKVKDVKPFTKRQNAVIKGLKQQKKSAEERLKKYSKIQKDQQDAYDEILENLDAIEGTTDDAPIESKEAKLDALKKDAEKIEA